MDHEYYFHILQTKFHSTLYKLSSWCRSFHCIFTAVTEHHALMARTEPGGKFPRILEVSFAYLVGQSRSPRIVVDLLVKRTGIESLSFRL